MYGAVPQTVLEGVKTTLSQVRPTDAMVPFCHRLLEGEPADEIGSYIRRKLESSRQFPRESRLFANEMLAGAPHIGDFLQSELKQLVDEKAAIFQGWIDEGRLAPCDPRHLLFAIWSTTQHYADFSVQVRHVLGLQPGDVSYYEEALSMLETLFLSRLVPPASTD